MKHRNQMDVPVKTFTHWEQTKEGSMPLSIETQLHNLQMLSISPLHHLHLMNFLQHVERHEIQIKISQISSTFIHSSQKHPFWLPTSPKSPASLDIGLWCPASPHQLVDSLCWKNCWKSHSRREMGKWPVWQPKEVFCFFGEFSGDFREIPSWYTDHRCKKKDLCSAGP